MKITNRRRLDYLLKLGHLTPMYTGCGPSRRRSSWGYRITFPLLGYGLPRNAIDAAIRAGERNK